MKPLDQEHSQRLNLLRFPLIIGVVFIHSYGATMGFSGIEVGASRDHPVVGFVQKLISMEIAQTAVPLYFLMSGYLFFLGFEWSPGNYAGKLKSRVRTLFVPFVVWNLANLLLKAAAQSWPPTQQYFSGRNAAVADFGPFGLLSALFGIGQMPIAYQFWFIRDLMLLVLLTPVTCPLIQRAPGLLLAILFACWFCDLPWTFAPSAVAALFFCAGGVLGSRGASLFTLDRHLRGMTIAYAALVVFDTLCFTSWAHPFVHRIGVLLGVAVMLSATKLALERLRLRNALLSLAAASFLVYAAHEPLLTILKKLAYKILRPDQPAVILALYFAIPILVIVTLVIAHRVLSRCFPKFTGVITGGR